MSEAIVRFKESTAGRIMRAVTEIENLRGSGVKRNPGMGITIATPRRSAPRNPKRSSAVAQSVRLKIISNCSRYGTYLAKIVTSLPAASDFNISTSGTFDDSDIGTVSSGSASSDYVIAVNLNERGQSTHALTDGTPDCHHWWAFPNGRTDNSSDMRAIYEINGLDAKLCGT